MKSIYLIFVLCLCSFSSSLALDIWDYQDTFAADSTENDDYSIIYSPIFPGRYSDEDNFVSNDDIDSSETPTKDLDENTIPTLPEEPSVVTVDRTETPISKENAAIVKLNVQVDKLMSELKAQQDKIAELENANKKLQSKVDFVEEQTKTNSLIFFNVHENDRENHKQTLSKVLYLINKLMKIKMGANDISVALRASPSDSSNLTHNRPIVVRMAKFVDKMKIVSASGRLSNTQITVAVDYSERVAMVRRQLLPYLTEARNEGRQAFLLYDSLVVDGQRLTLEQLQEAASRHRIDCMEPEEDVGRQVEEVEVVTEAVLEPLGDY